jgi:hypothetical protein
MVEKRTGGSNFWWWVGQKFIGGDNVQIDPTSPPTYQAAAE